MPEETTKKTLDERQLVVFKVGNEEFGVNINEVREINRWEEVTRIPNSAAYIKGVINLRGNIIVVTDLAMKLGMPSKEIDDDTRILVVDVGDNQTVGMVVDSATEVLRISGEKIRDAPSMITSNIDSDYIEGVGLLDEKRLLTLLDLAKVLESKDYEKIMKAQKISEQNMKKKEASSKPEKKTEKKPETTPEIKEEKPAEAPKPKEEKKIEEKPVEEKLPTETPAKEEKLAEPEKKEEEKLPIEKPAEAAKEEKKK